MIDLCDLGEELVTPHADEQPDTFEGHREPMQLMLLERVDPRHHVRVVAVEKCPVDVEKDGLTACLSPLPQLHTSAFPSANAERVQAPSKSPCLMLKARAAQSLPPYAPRCGEIAKRITDAKPSLSAHRLRSWAERYFSSTASSAAIQALAPTCALQLSHHRP